MTRTVDGCTRLGRGALAGRLLISARGAQSYRQWARPRPPRLAVPSQALEELAQSCDAPAGSGCVGRLSRTQAQGEALGRSYRLLLVDDDDLAVPVKLAEGRFKMARSAAGNGRQHMTAWYKDHGHAWLSARVERFGARLDIAPRRMAVRDLGYRWGSCGRDGSIYFHWRSVLLPPRIVEYVVAHEIVHLYEPYHSAESWLRVERAMPDFAARKRWLAEHGYEATAV